MPTSLCFALLQWMVALLGFIKLSTLIRVGLKPQEGWEMLTSLSCLCLCSSKDIQSVSWTFRYRSHHSKLLCTCWKKATLPWSVRKNAVKPERPFFFDIQKHPFREISRHLLCRVAGSINAQSETGVFTSMEKILNYHLPASARSSNKRTEHKLTYVYAYIRVISHSKTTWVFPKIGGYTPKSSILSFS